MPARISSSSSASQAQPDRRRHRARDEEDSDDDDREARNAASEEEAEATSRAGLTEEDLKKKAAKLIRLALAAEHNKRALKRADTNKIIPNPRTFPAVLLRAQQVLRTTFGMEIVELRPKWKPADDLAGPSGQASQAQTQGQATQATKRKGKGRQALADVDEDDEDDLAGNGETQAPTQGQGGRKVKSKSTGLYVLRSTLAPELLDRMAEPKAINVEYPVESDLPDDSGALLDWERNDGTQSGHIALQGIRTVILCLVMCSGRVISDDQLHVLLKRLSLERETQLPFLPCTSPHSAPLTLDKYLDLLDKQLYLQKIKIPTPGQGEGFSIEWRWGQRDSEMSEKAAAEFIERIMFHGLDDEGDADGDGDVQPTAAGRNEAAGRGRHRGNNEDSDEDEDGVGTIKQQRKRMRKNLAQAEGGLLHGVI